MDKFVDNKIAKFMTENGYQDFFTNDKKYLCPVTSCKIMEVGCQTEKTDLKNLKLQ